MIFNISSVIRHLSWFKKSKSIDYNRWLIDSMCTYYYSSVLVISSPVTYCWVLVISYFYSFMLFFYSSLCFWSSIHLYAMDWFSLHPHNCSSCFQLQLCCSLSSTTYYCSCLQSTSCSWCILIIHLHPFQSSAYTLPFSIPILHLMILCFTILFKKNLSRKGKAGVKSSELEVGGGDDSKFS